MTLTTSTTRMPMMSMGHQVSLTLMTILLSKDMIGSHLEATKTCTHPQGSTRHITMTALDPRIRRSPTPTLVRHPSPILRGNPSSISSHIDRSSHPMMKAMATVTQPVNRHTKKDNMSPNSRLHPRHHHRLHQPTMCLILSFHPKM